MRYGNLVGGNSPVNWREHLSVESSPVLTQTIRALSSLHTTQQQQIHGEDKGRATITIAKSGKHEWRRVVLQQWSSAAVVSRGWIDHEATTTATTGMQTGWSTSRVWHLFAMARVLALLLSSTLHFISRTSFMRCIVGCSVVFVFSPCPTTCVPTSITHFHNRFP